MGAINPVDENRDVITLRPTASLHEVYFLTLQAENEKRRGSLAPTALGLD
jgi:hypothetical protein